MSRGNGHQECAGVRSTGAEAGARALCLRAGAELLDDGVRLGARGAPDRQPHGRADALQLAAGRQGRGHGPGQQRLPGDRRPRPRGGPYRPGRDQPTIILCSGLGAERITDRELFAWLRRADRSGAVVGALCTGAHLLAKAGLLHNHRCTIHWENLPGFMEAFPEIEVSADLFEVDGKRLTCSGGTAALDLMLHLIARDHGQELAVKVSEQCLLDRIRQPHDHQRMPYRVRLGIHHAKLIGAIEMMESNVEEPLDQEMLARYVGLSRRQLERLFKKHLGRTPAQYYLELRLERARHLLYQTRCRS